MASEARTTTPTASPISAIASTSIASGTSRGPAGRAPFIPPNARCARPQSTNSSRTVFDKSPLPHLPPGFHLDVCATDPVSLHCAIPCTTWSRTPPAIVISRLASHARRPRPRLKLTPSIPSPPTPPAPPAHATPFHSPISPMASPHRQSRQISRGSYGTS